MMKIARCVTLAAAILVHLNASAQELLDLGKPITLDIPGMELPFVTSLQPLGGWPLTIRMFANKPLGIGTKYNAGVYPPLADRAWIVWADPDGVFSFACITNAWSPPCPATDETYLEFAPGVTKWPTTLVPLKVKSYTFNIQDPTYVGNTTDRELSIPEGVLGKSSAVPGLVILSDTGVGREFVLDEHTGIAQTGKAWNLAGFISSVEWTVNDRKPFLPRTSVTAQLHVPTGLFKPVLFVDYGACAMAGVTIPVPCPAWKWTFDGVFASGPPQTFSAAIAAKVTTVRIFVVDGPAPDKVANENGDSVIDSRDVLRMTNPVTGKPYKLLSGERVIRFQTLEQEELPAFPFDFDGDGMGQPVLPAGGGGVKPIPR
jgi:hypothetical protein